MSLLGRAFARWAAGTVVLCLGALLYLHHPHYAEKNALAWRSLFRLLFWGWIVVGLPYVMLVLKRFAPTPRCDRSDSLLMLLGAAGRLRALLEGRENARRPLAKPMKSAILALLVKGFFLPLMTGFFLGHLGAVSTTWADLRGLGAPPQFPLEGLSTGTFRGFVGQMTAFLPRLVPTGADVTLFFHPSRWADGAAERAFGFATDGVFLVDCGFAFFGYLAESRFLGNKTKSVEPTMLGWMAAIFCYPPFNSVLGTWLPMGGKAIITARPVLLGLRAATLAFYTIYTWATVAFGMKFSNLTNRGIVTTGPYRFLRHPAYVCKGIAWWLEQVPNLDAGTVASLIGINIVYALRAYTEERHLRADPAYREYAKKVPWVLVPGVW
jgi:protein-S-isoprenylcysteine O-methyltransferase Ste14